jgi:Archaeal/vacuolar-type H+-ATPase subunit A
MLRVTKISGPLVTAEIDSADSRFPKLLETVYVGHKRLLGEIIKIFDNECKIQFMKTLLVCK